MDMIFIPCFHPGDVPRPHARRMLEALDNLPEKKKTRAGRNAPSDSSKENAMEQILRQIESKY